MNRSDTRLFRLARWIGGILCLLSACALKAGVVRTIDGRTIEGTVSFRDGEIAIQPRIGQPIRIAPDQVLAIDFGRGEGWQTKPLPGELPVPWVAADIGSVGLAGRTVFQSDRFDVTGSGAESDGKADAFHFVHQQAAAGDVELVGRMVGIQNTPPAAMGGLAIRVDDTPGSAGVMLVARLDGNVRMVLREDRGKSARSLGQRQLQLPVSLKLVRQGRRISGFASPDGQAWVKIGEGEIRTDGAALAGMAVMSGDNAARCTARFDSVTLTQATSAGDGPSGTVPYARPHVTLRNGHIWPGAIDSIRSDAVHLARDGRKIEMPLVSVARVVLRPLPTRRLADLPAGITGVQLANGDFYDGQVEIARDNRIRVNSLLHGIRTFATSDVAVVVFDSPKPPAGAVTIRTADGATVSTERLSIQGDRLEIDDPLLGELRWSAAELRDVVALAGRSRRLAELTPARVEGAALSRQAWSAQEGVLGRPARLREVESDDVISTAGGVAVTYRLDGAYRTFFCTAGIDVGVAPLLAGRLVVRVDGAVAYASEPMTSLDRPALVAVALDGARELTLIVEGADGGVAPAGVWADALLVRPSE